MTNTILITDSLFIFPEHEEVLKNAGYELERLDKPQATEAELIEAVKGKVGYILGGIEKITDNVIAAATDLKAIAFTGSDWKAFIPGHEAATARNIAIANTPGANSYAVAEYAMTLMFAMMREIFDLGKTGSKTFKTTRSLNELTVGIVGMGKVGTRVATNLAHLGAKKTLYFNRSRKPDIEHKGVEYRELDDLLRESDIVFLLVPKSSGEKFLAGKHFKLMKDSAILINIASPILVDKDALFTELQSGRLRAAFDEKIDERFAALPLSHWFSSNESTAYNTLDANKTASDMAVKSILNLLADGNDEYKVN